MASSEYSSLKTAVGATPTPAHQQYLKQGQRSYYEAVGYAHEQYSDFMAAASGAVYGTPTPAMSSMSNMASEAIYGTPVPAYQSLLDVASSSFAQATADAAGLIGSVSKAETVSLKVLNPSTTQPCLQLRLHSPQPAMQQALLFTELKWFFRIHVKRRLVKLG